MSRVAVMSAMTDGFVREASSRGAAMYVTGEKVPSSPLAARSGRFGLYTEGVTSPRTRAAGTP